MSYITHYAVAGLEQIPTSVSERKADAMADAKSFISTIHRGPGEYMDKLENGYSIRHRAGGTVAIATVTNL